MAVRRETLDGLLAEHDPQALFSRERTGYSTSYLKLWRSAFANAVIQDHLDGEAATKRRNRRSGYSKKRVLTEAIKLDLRILATGRRRSIRS